MITIIVALVVGGIVIFAIVSERSSGPDTDGKTGDETVLKNGVSEAQANCTDVQDFPNAGRDHIQVGQDPDPPYNSTPPTSGDHYEIPAQTGFYSSPLDPHQVVHNEEHGQIIFWYRSDAPQTLKDDIQILVNQQDEATVATPFDDIESPYNFVISAWQHMQSCEEISQKVVDDFRREFQGHGPEPFAKPFTG